MSVPGTWHDTFRVATDIGSFGGLCGIIFGVLLWFVTTINTRQTLQQSLSTTTRMDSDVYGYICYKNSMVWIKYIGCIFGKFYSE